MPSHWKEAPERHWVFSILFPTELTVPQNSHCQAHGGCSVFAEWRSEPTNGRNLRAGLGGTGAQGNQQCPPLVGPAEGGWNNTSTVYLRA